MESSPVSMLLTTQTVDVGTQKISSMSTYVDKYIIISNIALDAITAYMIKISFTIYWSATVEYLPKYIIQQIVTKRLLTAMWSYNLRHENYNRL